MSPAQCSRVKIPYVLHADWMKALSLKQITPPFKHVTESDKSVLELASNSPLRIRMTTGWESVTWTVTTHRKFWWIVTQARRIYRTDHLGLILLGVSQARWARRAWDDGCVQLGDEGDRSFEEWAEGGTLRFTGELEVERGREDWFHRRDESAASMDIAQGCRKRLGDL